MNRAFGIVGILALLLSLWGLPASAAGRVALVIGNGAYENAPNLPNPANDARDVAKALQQLGFDTLLGVDLDQDAMRDLLIKFAKRSRGADVALFYYSGHALQYQGGNYLMPVDAELVDAADLPRLVPTDQVVADLQQNQNLSILVLDACRDNPLADNLRRAIGDTRSARSIVPGLAPIHGRGALLVSFATQPGQTASDGDGQNSPYTQAFLRHIGEPAEIVRVFRNVAADVDAATDHNQLPELSQSLVKDYYLAGMPDGPGVAPAPDPAAAAWTALGDTHDRQVLNAFLAQFPTGFYATLARKRLAALEDPKPVEVVRTPSDGRFPFAAIVTRGAELYAEPELLGQVRRKLPVGETVTVAGAAASPLWYRVRDRNGLDGYVRKDNLRPLK